MLLSKIDKVEQLILQGTSFCNVNCTYCDLDEESRNKRSKMPLDLPLRVLEELIDLDLISSSLTVVWHSGEPLVLPISYYCMAIELILELFSSKFSEVKLKFDFQTNAILLNDEWCDFFEKYRKIVNIGISCDGPEVFHNSFRVDRRGGGTFEKVVRGMDMLEHRNIPYNVIAVVTRKTMFDPLKFIEFFYERRDKITDFHFNILASPINKDKDLKYQSADKEEFKRFYGTLLKWWFTQSNDEKIFPIRNFTQALNRITDNYEPISKAVLQASSAPLKSLNIDYEGNITTFYAGLDVGTMRDFYGDLKGFGMGNIYEQTIFSMIKSEKFSLMISDFLKMNTKCFNTCEYYNVCPGGFELIQLANSKNTCINPESVECIVHVKALTDATLDFVEKYA